MSIKGVSDIRRLPRLGKIRLGIKETSNKTGNSYPKSVDHFVCPPEVQAVYGEKPRVLDITLPVEDKDVFFPQWYKRYGLSTGLVCKGDGETAIQVNADGEMQEIECCPDECEFYAKKHCRRLANFQFLLPKVPGLGIWQIDTTSFYSIVNLNSAIEMIRAVAGRIRMIPLQLVLKPQEVQPDGKKKTVYVLDLVAPYTLQKLIAAGQNTSPTFLLPGVDENERPDDLYPDAVLEKDKKPLNLDQKPEKQWIGVGGKPARPEINAALNAMDEQPAENPSHVPDWVNPTAPVNPPDNPPVETIDEELQAAWDALGTPPAKRQAVLKKPGLDKHGLLVQLRDEITRRGKAAPKKQAAPAPQMPPPASPPVQQQQSFF